MRFDELDLDDAVLDGLEAMNFVETTPIQELAIPPILAGKDLIGCAQTGTGKTAAYVLPIISQLSRGGYPQDAINAVIMAPTRELAQQIDQQIDGFTYFVSVSAVAVYGGTDGIAYARQERGLQMGADIVIATPGRLISHLNMGSVDLSRTSFFVLDEADRMLDMGFHDDIMQIYKHLPKECQVVMFSATMPPKIRTLAHNILKDPEEIKIAVSRPPESIMQTAYICYEAHKMPLLKQLFAKKAPERVIIVDSKCTEWATYKTSVTEFLYGLLTRTVDCPILVYGEHFPTSYADMQGVSAILGLPVSSTAHFFLTPEDSTIVYKNWNDIGPDWKAV